DAKAKRLTAVHGQWCFGHIKTIPDPGVSYDMVTKTRFGFWDFVPTFLNIAEPAVIAAFYASPWLLKRRRAVEVLDPFERGKISKIGFLTGLDFKRRESSTFATLYEGLAAGGQRFRACLNHAKFFTALFCDGNALTCESSANFTENGNIETHVLTND